ncbi:CASP-like protein 1U1 [Phragmites australis]|uniref:CASP-like protein 1U1 n=1 Tax=Phragmites australis TaxID=29695 RepID=UPI002D79041D|nr:CASP-like protein 1U1 [Phragmites australis]
MGGASFGETISLVFRILTVGLSLASAIMTATSTQSMYRDDGIPAATVSYSDYHSLRYAALANLLSAVLQGVTICLEATRNRNAARIVELIDNLVQALTSTSAALLLAVDDITSCGGPPRRRGPRGQRNRGGICGQAGAFCRRVSLSSVLSIAAVVSVSVSVYTRDKLFIIAKIVRSTFLFGHFLAVIASSSLQSAPDVLVMELLG